MKSEIRTEQIKRVSVLGRDLLKELEIDPNVYKIKDINICGDMHGQAVIDLHLVEIPYHEARK